MSGRKQSLAALGLYTGVSFVLFGFPIFREFSRFYIGVGVDPTAAMWYLAWWPHALRNGLSPFVTPLLWAPIGSNLTWRTSIPGLSVLGAPITLTLGPVIAYNVLSLLSPALAGWTTYLLCRHITRSFWPSVIGGYVFGFSTYELSQLSAHLNLSFVCLVPLAVLLVLLHMDGLLTPASFVPILGLALALQFSFSTEVFATMTLFGALAVLLALACMPPDIRRRLASAGGWIISAYAVAAVIVAPWLYYTFADRVPGRPINDPRVHSSDLLNFLLPTPITWIGGDALSALTSRFMGNRGEQSAYLGLPLLVIVLLFARSHWRMPACKLLTLSFFLACFASLGPKLNVSGNSTISLPWRVAFRLPLISQALPARFMMYAFLAAAVIAAIALGTTGRRRWLHWSAALLGLLLLFPNLAGSHWKSSLDRRPFFSDGLYRRFLSRGENALVIPYGGEGHSMFWQLESGMYFRLAASTGLVPQSFLRWPIVFTLQSGTLIPGYGRQLKAFLDAHGITAVIVAEPGRAPWEELFSTLGVAPVEVGGVRLYRVNTSGASPSDLDRERRVKLAEFSALLMAAHTYVSSGREASRLTPRRAEGLGLLPAAWGGGRPSAVRSRDDRQFRTGTGLWLSPWPGDMVAAGMTGSHRELSPVIDCFRPDATAIYLPYPARLDDARPSDGELRMIFTREGLARAAGRSCAPPSGTGPSSSSGSPWHRPVEIASR